MISEIFIYFCNFIQAFLIINFLTKFFRAKLVQQFTIGKKFLSIMLIFITLQLGNLLALGDMLITAFNFFILFLYCNKYLLGSRVQHSIMILIILLLIPLINVNFLQVVIYIGNISLEDYLNVNNPYYLLGIVSVLIIYSIILSVMLKFGKSMKVFFDKKYSIIYGLILGYSILAEGAIFYSLQNNVQISKYHLGLLFISCGAVGIDIYIVFSMCKISEQQYQKEKIRILQFQNLCQEQQIKEIRRSEKRIQRLRHDYKNTILNLRELLKNCNIQESMDYLEKLDGYYMKEFKEYIFTGNSLIDATLNSKFNICHEEGIELSSNIIGEFDKIDGFIITIILFNLLDNAIEATQKVEQRKIQVEMVIKGEYFSCVIKNLLKESVLQKNEKLITDKVNKKEHGLGIEHIRELVENENGLLEFFETKDYFCVHVMVPLECL